MSNQTVTTINLDQLLEESGTFQYTNHETGPIVPLVIIAILVIVGLNFVSDLIKASIKNERQSSKKTSRPHIPAKSLVKNVSKAEELPELAPVAASIAPEVEPVTAAPVIEAAPEPVVDPTFGWSKPVIDEAVLSIPAYIRKAGITSYAAYRRLNPLKTPVVLLSKAREPSPDSMPVFDLGERLPVGFDGQPVH